MEEIKDVLIDFRKDRRDVASLERDFSMSISINGSFTSSKERSDEERKILSEAVNHIPEPRVKTKKPANELPIDLLETLSTILLPFIVDPE